MANAIEFVDVSSNYPIMQLTGTWSTREISGNDCLTMAINQNANNNGFILLPTVINGYSGYTILTLKSEGTDAFLIDTNSNYGTVGGYNEFGGFRLNSGITRPDLRGIRLGTSSGLTPNYSGNVNGNNIVWNNNTYNAFGYAQNANLTILIYLPSSVTNILINDNPLVTYNWQSVPSISGKNGISLLSIIKSSAINSGDAVSGASADVFDRLEESTKISTLIQGISEETPIIYSDDVNYMSITPTANNTCTLKFYLHGNVIYTLTDVSINAYLSFLIDETNGIMKPSIIYEDS